LVGRGLFKTKRHGARSYAKWELCWRSRSRISVIKVAADIYPQFGTPPTAKLSFLIQDRRMQEPLQSDGAMLDWIAVPDFLAAYR
jgi:hypothetical protein